MEKIKPILKPYPLAKLQKLVGKPIREVVRVSIWGTVIGDVENLNDYASEAITGSDCGLEEISYKLVGCNPRNEEVYIRVDAYVSDYFEGQENGEQDE